MAGASIAPRRLTSTATAGSDADADADAEREEVLGLLCRAGRMRWPDEDVIAHDDVADCDAVLIVLITIVPAAVREREPESECARERVLPRGLTAPRGVSVFSRTNLQITKEKKHDEIERSW